MGTLPVRMFGNNAVDAYSELCTFSLNDLGLFSMKIPACSELASAKMDSWYTVAFLRQLRIQMQQ